MKHAPSVIKVEPAEMTGLQQTVPAEYESTASIWEAAEAFSSPDLLKRVAGVERLVADEALRQFPLVAYLLFTRITEPDIELRTCIVKALGSLVNSSEQAPAQKEDVQKTLFDRLASMQTREILSILEVVAYSKSAEQSVMDLIGGCSQAGGSLSQILTDREVPLEIRCQAANVIGQMGFLEAQPAVERLMQRLESRCSEEEESLLRILKRDVELLNAQ